MNRELVVSVHSSRFMVGALPTHDSDVELEKVMMSVGECQS